MRTTAGRERTGAPDRSRDDRYEWEGWRREGRERGVGVRTDVEEGTSTDARGVPVTRDIDDVRREEVDVMNCDNWFR